MGNQRFERNEKSRQSGAAWSERWTGIDGLS